MGRFRGKGGFCRFARLLGIGAGCLALAHCSGGVNRINPRYGVAASPRVVPLGERAPKGGGVYRVGTPYTIAGRTYVPNGNPENYHAVGYASWYGDDFHGRYTANGEIFDEQSVSAASPILPLPSYARVTNLANHRSIIVRVNDRGPYAKNRLIDVSRRTAKLLGFYGQGVTKVRVDYVGMAPLAGSNDRMLMATLRERAPAELVRVASNQPFVRTLFENRSIAEAPMPPERPYDLGEGGSEAASQVTQARTPAFVVASRAPPPADSPLEGSPLVSAYASVGYDSPAAGFMSGRGLY
jgi:peptidoglycan lytic transglycosylase